MSSPIGSSGDVGSIYQTPSQAELDEADIEQVEDPNILSQFSDTVEQALPLDPLGLGDVIQDVAAPVLALPDPSAVLASEQQVGAFMQQVSSSAGAMMANFVSGLSPTLQAQLAVNKTNGGVQNLNSAIKMQAKLDALINAGLSVIPSAPPPDYSNLFQLKGPAPLNGAVPANLTQAQQFINQTLSVSRAAQIMGKEVAAVAPDNVNPDSYSQFLAFVSMAIHNLQSYMDSVAQSDLKGNVGQATDAGSDRQQVNQAKADKAKEEAGGGIMGFLSSILSIAGLMDILSAIWQMPIPGFTELLKLSADILEPIPMVGPFAKVMAENPGQAMLILILICVQVNAVIMLGPVGIAMIAAQIAVLMVVMQSLGGGNIGPVMDDLPGELGDTFGPLTESFDLESFLSGELPLIGDGPIWLAELLAPIPLVGDIAAWGAENQGAMALVLLISLVSICFAPILMPVLLVVMMFAMGDAGEIPIVGALFADPELQRTTAADRKERNAVATANSIGKATQKVAEDSGASEDTAKLISMIMKLIAMLMNLKSAAQGGTVGPISMSEIMGVVGELTKMGIGGEAFKQAEAAGATGDMQGMFDQLNQGFGLNELTPATMATTLQGALDGYVMGPDTGAYNMDLSQT
ncbi:MAG: hypothetical protein Q8K75_11255 [Chlamydiales bacterium]|nr:hypothetical protein [Chlamydiales bacterium]